MRPAALVVATLVGTGCAGPAATTTLPTRNIRGDDVPVEDK